MNRERHAIGWNFQLYDEKYRSGKSDIFSL